jgi:hypothetical protein
VTERLSTYGQQARLHDIMRRHVRAEDSELTDDAFVRAVLKRYEDARGEALIDPNE